MPEERQPTPVLDPESAYGRWAANYPPYAHNPLMQAEERAMLALLPHDLHAHRVFDAGCGTGRYIIHALRRGARQVLGADLSLEMLCRAASELSRETASPDGGAQRAAPTYHLVRARLPALPVRDAWADLTLCALTIGHLSSLQPSLAELRRITRPGGTILCSDFHPIGHALGWRREFNAGGCRYAVRHTPHERADWERACGNLGLRIERVLEPLLDPAQISPDAHFDRAALELPVAIVFELRRA